MLAIDRQESAEDGISSLSVVPSAEGAAPFSVAWNEAGDLAFISVGEATTLEIPKGDGRFTSHPSGLELRTLLRAIVDGRFKEELTTNIRDRVVASRGEFQLPDGVVSITDTAFPWSLFGRYKTVRRYRPYI